MSSLGTAPEIRFSDDNAVVKRSGGTVSSTSSTTYVSAGSATVTSGKTGYIFQIRLIIGGDSGDNTQGRIKIEAGGNVIYEELDLSDYPVGGTVDISLSNPIEVASGGTIEAFVKTNGSTVTNSGAHIWYLEK